MSTERQKQASRANGARSRGPVTPQGKRNSSRNATKHSLLSGTIVLEGESTDRFLSLVTDLHEEFQPQTPFEESLIENMAAARWRQMRIWGIEKAGMEDEMRRQRELSGLNPDGSNADASNLDNATRAARAFRALSDDSRSIELMNRYDARCERQYYRAHRRLLEVRSHSIPPPDQTPYPDAHQPNQSPSPDLYQSSTERPEAPRVIEMPAPAENRIAKRTQQIAANKEPIHTRPNGRAGGLFSLLRLSHSFRRAASPLPPPAACAMRNLAKIA